MKLGYSGKRAEGARKAFNSSAYAGLVVGGREPTMAGMTIYSLAKERHSQEIILRAMQT